MNNHLDFMVYCLEYYKKDKKMSGAQIAHLFAEYGVLEYIKSCYGALHTTSPQYIIEDIDGFILSRRSDGESVLH